MEEQRNMKIAVICIVILVGLMIVEKAFADPASEVEAYIRDARKGMNSEKTDKLAQAITGPVVLYSEKYKIDPLLVCVLIETESSFDVKAEGTNKEIGLMQAKPVWYRFLGTDPTTYDGQIATGVYVLWRSIDACGDILHGLSRYHMGKNKCSFVSKRAKYKYRLYLKAVERFRK